MVAVVCHDDGILRYSPVQGAEKTTWINPRTRIMIQPLLLIVVLVSIDPRRQRSLVPGPGDVPAQRILELRQDLRGIAYQLDTGLKIGAHHFRIDINMNQL